MRALKLVTACFLFLLAYTASYADTVKMDFVSTGGANDGKYEIYPYNFDINGSKTATQLMCVSFNNEVFLGETWSAVTTAVTTSSSALSQEDAYLFSLIGTAGYTTEEIQEAVWYLSAGSNSGNVAATAFDKAMASTAQAEVTDLSGKPPAWDNGEFLMYTPVAGSQNPLSDGTPQSYIGFAPAALAPTPEPSSLILLATGLLGAGGLLSRKGRNQS